MTLRLNSRLLDGVNSSSFSPSPSSSSSSIASIDSDFVVILAALLCALICVLGLVAVARCAWIRRISGTAPAPPPAAATTTAATSKGLKKKSLNSLPKLAYSPDSHSGVDECAICLAEFAAGDEIRILPLCSHGFHVGCIDTWLGSHSSCPSCRMQILVASNRCDRCGDTPAAAASSSSAAATTRTRREDAHIDDFLP